MKTHQQKLVVDFNHFHDIYFSNTMIISTRVITCVNTFWEFILNFQVPLWAKWLHHVKLFWMMLTQKKKLKSTKICTAQTYTNTYFLFCFKTRLDWIEIKYNSKTKRAHTEKQIYKKKTNRERVCGRSETKQE